MSVKCHLCGQRRTDGTNGGGGCRCAGGYSAYHDIQKKADAFDDELRFQREIANLRHDIEHHVRIATEVTQEAEQLRAELAASRHELEGAKKAANAQARIIESLQQQRAHLNAQRDQWIEARNTLDSERAANACLTEELAASREREARMHNTIDALLAHCPDGECAVCAQAVCPHGEPLHFHHDGCPACAQEAALTEGAQG